MFEYYVAVGMFFVAIFFYQIYPIVRHYMNYRKERYTLTKKYNRLYRARKDLLVSNPQTPSRLVHELTK